MSGDKGYMAVRARYSRDMEEKIRDLPGRAQRFYQPFYGDIPDLMKRITKDAERVREQAQDDPEVALALAESIERSERNTERDMRGVEERFEVQFGYQRPATVPELDALGGNQAQRWRAVHYPEAEPEATP